jgi:hypothetical protein
MVRKLNIEHGKRNIEHRTPKFEVGAFGLRITTECLAYLAISVFDIRCSFLRLVLG